jgi:hypothetical protein
MSTKDKVELFCTRINKYYPFIYSDIHIPFNFFKSKKFDIPKILDDNSDILFYSDCYFTFEDKVEFNIVYEMHKKVLTELFNPDNSFSAFLIKCDATNTRKKIDTTINLAALSGLITNHEYSMISPVIILDFFLDFRKTMNAFDAIKNTENELKLIMNEINYHISTFRNNFIKIVHEFVFDQEYLSPDPDKFLMHGLVNSTIMESLNFTKKVSEYNVYPINYIISNIVNEYLPLNRIIVHEYDSTDPITII